VCRRWTPRLLSVAVSGRIGVGCEGVGGFLHTSSSDPSIDRDENSIFRCPPLCYLADCQRTMAHDGRQWHSPCFVTIRSRDSRAYIYPVALPQRNFTIALKYRNLMSPLTATMQASTTHHHHQWHPTTRMQLHSRQTQDLCNGPGCSVLPASMRSAVKYRCVKCADPGPRMCFACSVAMDKVCKSVGNCGCAEAHPAGKVSSKEWR